MTSKIKLAIVIGLNPDKKSSLKSDLDDLLSFLSKLGYNGIELSLLEPERVPVEELNELLDSHSMKVAAIGTGSTYIRLGHSIASPDTDSRRKAIDRLKIYAEFSEKVQGKPKIIIGLIRGRRPKGQDPYDEQQNMIESLWVLDTIAEENGVEMVLEPINRFEIDSIHVLAEAIEILNKASVKNIYPMVDSFHVHLEEDITEIHGKLKEYAREIRHVHIAGCNRRAPNDCCFDFKKFIDCLVNNGYDGFFSVEAIPKPTLKDLARQSADFIRKIL
ncbi:MAG: sugar phosphate isomerase/epimerase family protein [Promethearchaeota archaeon]